MKLSIKKRHLLNVAVLLLAILFCLACIEIFLQVTYKKPITGDHFEFSQQLGWENRKNFENHGFSKELGKELTIKTNSIGLRTEKEYSPQKDKPRIAIIGDSFVFGTGISQEDIIGVQLQKLLPEYEVISAGTVGYSTTQYLQYYEERIKQFHPDIVVFCVFVNDFAENSYNMVFGYTKPWIYKLEENLSLRKEMEQQVPRPIPPDTYQRPLLILPSLIKEKIAAWNPPKEQYANSPYRYNQGFYLFEQTLIQPAAYALVLEQQVLNVSAQIMKQDNVTFVVLYIPARMQVDTVYRERFMMRFTDKDKFSYNYQNLNRIMQSMQNDISYHYLDLTPALLDTNNPGAYYLNDGHLNPKGTAFLDEQLFKYLNQNNLLKR